MSIDLSIVVPTINSAQMIEKTADYIHNYLKKLKDQSIIGQYEIILASQTSKDNTFEVIKQLAQKNQQIKGLYLPTPGKGLGLNAGLQAAQYNQVVMIDDDLSYPIEFLEEALKGLENHQIIIGSRYITKQNIPFKRKLASFVYRHLVKLLFRLPVEDTQAGLKLIDKKIFQKIPYPQQKGYVWDTELLLAAHRAGFQIKEIPIKYDFTENQLRVEKVALKMFRELLQLYFKN